MSDRRILPFAVHPAMREQIEKRDAKKPEAEKVLKKTKTKVDTKSSTTKQLKAQIIENKPKKKVVRDYFAKRVDELESDSEME